MGLPWSSCGMIFFPVCYSAHWLYSVVYGVFNVVIIKEGDTAFLMLTV